MPINGAGTIIFNADKTQVLLCKREDFRVWVTPGGGVEDGESLEEAAIRETFEETGFRIAIDRPVGKYWGPQLPQGGVMMHLFQAHVVGGKATTCFETIDLGFFPINDLPPRTLSWAREQIADALAPSEHTVERTQLLPVHLAILLRVGIALRDWRNKHILKHHESG